MINWFKSLFTSKPDTDTGAIEGGTEYHAHLYTSMLSVVNRNKPQYAINFALTAEERSTRSRKSAATRKAKKEMTARLNHENLRRDLQASVDAA